SMFRSLTAGWKSLLSPAALLSLRSSSSGVNHRLKLPIKVAVVTGSTNGIGFAMAPPLAQDGAHVVIGSRKQQNVDRAVAKLRGEGLSVVGTMCHVGKTEVTMALEHCGGVDFLVTLGSSEQVWDKILNVNMKAPALLLSQLLPHMEKRGLLLSVSFCPQLLGAHNVSKTALLGLTKTLAVELAPKNIRVNCLAPGFINTDFSQVVRAKGPMGKMSLVSASLLSLCREGQSEDCVGLVSFLCSQDDRYITGENIMVAAFSPLL
uniref:Dehydrogenase/reductase SDR family member 2, mitochondrial n=1 Tax=Castor canadensis TaxID=51338 RepID=A0A8C0ZUM2_CASCN